MSKLDQIQVVSIKELVADPLQPRQTFLEDEMEKLEKSIAKQGILVPITVEKSGEGYLIIDGERRYRASLKVGLTKVPVIIHDAMDTTERIMTRFHIQEMHANWSAFDKAKAIMTLKKASALTDEELSELLGLSKATIRNYMSLLILSKRSMSEANAANLPFDYVRGIANIVAKIDDIDKRAEVEKAVLLKIKNRVVLTGKALHDYSTAVKTGGEKVLQRLIVDEKFTPKQALKMAGIDKLFENKRVIRYGGWLTAMLKKGLASKSNKELTQGDAQTLRNLAKTIENYLDSAGSGNYGAE